MSFVLRIPVCILLGGGQVESNFQTSSHFKMQQELSKQVSWQAVDIVSEYL